MEEINEGVFDFMKSPESVMKEVCDQIYDEELAYINKEYEIKLEIAKISRFLVEAERDYKKSMKEAPDSDSRRLEYKWKDKKDEINRKIVNKRADLSTYLGEHVKKMRQLLNLAELKGGNDKKRIKYFNERRVLDGSRLNIHEQEKKRELNSLLKGLNLDFISSDIPELGDILSDLRSTMADARTRTIPPPLPSIPEEAPEESPERNGYFIDETEEDDEEEEFTTEEEFLRGGRYDYRKKNKTGEGDLVLHRISDGVFIKRVRGEKGEGMYNYLFLDFGNTDKNRVIFIVNIHGIDVPFILNKSEGDRNYYPLFGYNIENKEISLVSFGKRKPAINQDAKRNYYSYWENIPTDEELKKSPSLSIKREYVKLVKPYGEGANVEILNKISGEFKKVTDFFEENWSWEYSIEGDIPQTVTRNEKYYKQGHHYEIFYSLYGGRERSLSIKKVVEIVNQILVGSLSKSNIQRSISALDLLVKTPTPSSNDDKDGHNKNFDIVVRAIYAAIALSMGLVKPEELGVVKPVTSKKTTKDNDDAESQIRYAYGIPEHLNISKKEYKKSHSNMVKNFQEFNTSLNEGLPEMIGRTLKKGIDDIVGTPKGKMDALLKRIRKSIEDYIDDYAEQVDKLRRAETEFELSGYGDNEWEDLEEANRNLRDFQNSYRETMSGLRLEAENIAAGKQELMNYYDQELRAIQTLVKPKMERYEELAKKLRSEIDKIKGGASDVKDISTKGKLEIYSRMDPPTFRKKLRQEMSIDDIYDLRDEMEIQKDRLETAKIGLRPGTEKENISKRIASIKNKIEEINRIFRRSGQSNY